MGIFCSDPVPGSGVRDFRYALDAELDFCELSDCESETGCTNSEQSCTPSVKRVPIPVNQLRLYKNESKKRECFFDLDSVDEAHEDMEKAFSDVTSMRYIPNKQARLTKANLSKRDSKQNSHQGSMLRVHGQNGRWNSRRPRSVCSYQAGRNSTRPRSICSDKVLYIREKSNAYVDEGSSIISPRGYCIDERSLNASANFDEKSESESDSLKFPKFPRTRADATEQLDEGIDHKHQAIKDTPEQILEVRMNSFCKVKELKPISPNSNDTDKTSLGNCGSPEIFALDRQQRGVGSFNYTEGKKQTLKRDNSFFQLNHDSEQFPEVPMLIFDSSADNAIELQSRRSQETVVPSDMIKKKNTYVGHIMNLETKARPSKDCAEFAYSRRDFDDVELP